MLRMRRLGAGPRAGSGLGASKTQSRRSAMAMFRNGLTSWGRGFRSDLGSVTVRATRPCSAGERFGIGGPASSTGPLAERRRLLWGGTCRAIRPLSGRTACGRSSCGGRPDGRKGPSDPLPPRGPRTCPDHGRRGPDRVHSPYDPTRPSAIVASTLDRAIPGWTPNREGVVGCGALMHGKYRVAGEVSAGAVGHRFPCGGGPGPPHDPVLG